MAFSAAAAPSPCDLASARVIATARSWCAASFAASMVHSLANSMALWIASASRWPAAAPFAIAAVMPSMPCEAARADLVAAASIPDRFALTLLMDWFALSTSTVTTSSIWLLLLAMNVHPLAIQLVPFVVQDEHRVKLVGRDLVQADWMPRFSAARRSRARRMSRPASVVCAASSLSCGQSSQRPPAGASGHKPGSQSSSRRRAQWMR